MRNFIDTISEVYLSPAQEDPDVVLARYGAEMEQLPNAILGTHGALQLKKASMDGRTLLGLFEDGELISLLVVLDGNPASIARIATAEHAQGRGLVRYLITWWVQHEGPLLSDETQSPSAKRMWEQWIAAPGDPNIGMMAFFLVRDGEAPVPIRQAHGLEPNPWDNTDCRILVKKRQLTTEEIDRFRSNPARKERPIYWFSGRDGPSFGL